MSKGNRTKAFLAAVKLVQSGDILVTDVKSTVEEFVRILDGDPDLGVEEPVAKAEEEALDIGPDGKPMDFAKYRWFKTEAGSPRRVDRATGKVETHRVDGWGSSVFSLQDLIRTGSIFTEAHPSGPIGYHRINTDLAKEGKNPYPTLKLTPFYRYFVSKTGWDLYRVVCGAGDEAPSEWFGGSEWHSDPVIGCRTFEELRDNKNTVEISSNG